VYDQGYISRPDWYLKPTVRIRHRRAYKEFERISTSSANEGEHLVLYHNDRRRYATTADHSKGAGTDPSVGCWQYAVGSS